MLVVKDAWIGGRLVEVEMHVGGLESRIASRYSMEVVE